MATRLTDTPAPARSRGSREGGQPGPRAQAGTRIQAGGRPQAAGRPPAGVRSGGQPRSQGGTATPVRPAPRAPGPRSGVPRSSTVTPAPPRPRARPVSPPRPAAPPVQPETPARPAAPPRSRAGGRAAPRHKMPFLLLVVGMLAGALVCMLVISTTLAAGSFRITSLQKQDQALSKQQQQLQQQVSQDQAPRVIAQGAEQLGMKPVSQLEFLNVKTGQVSSNAATGSTAQIAVPGYTP